MLGQDDDWCWSHDGVARLEGGAVLSCDDWEHSILYECSYLLTLVRPLIPALRVWDYHRALR